MNKTSLGKEILLTSCFESYFLEIKSEIKTKIHEESITTIWEGNQNLGSHEKVIEVNEDS